MASAARHLCAVCPAFAVKGSRCAAHQPAYRGSSTRQGYGASWRRLRARFLMANPLCRKCRAAATEVDHIKPRSRGGTDALENLQALCKPHHSRKTAKEVGWAG